jgi:cystathionine beta-lyase/cystathionine gamma-synthase
MDQKRHHHRITRPFDSFLALRGVKTLALRLERHCSTALAFARWLESRPEVARATGPSRHIRSTRSLGAIYQASAACHRARTAQSDQRDLFPHC